MQPGWTVGPEQGLAWFYVKQKMRGKDHAIGTTQARILAGDFSKMATSFVLGKKRDFICVVRVGNSKATTCICAHSMRKGPVNTLQQTAQHATAHGISTPALWEMVQDCRTLVQELTQHPTPCRKLVMGEPDFVGIKVASLHGIGGIIVSHCRECKPTVFCMEWP